MKEPHELSKLFPLIGDSDLSALASDIEKNGQREPIMLYERKVLDGVQRQRACEIAGVKPFCVSFESQPPQIVKGGPLAYVVSQNLHRRHLDTSERTQIAVKVAAQIAKGERDELATGVTNSSKPGPKTRQKAADQQAAKLMHVSARSVERARAKEKPKRKPTESQLRKAKEKQEWLRQGLTVRHSIHSLIARAKRNHGSIYVELGEWGIRCARKCRN
jgi:hypothetical protein